MSAPFSAIIIVGALVLPDVIFGIIDASITLKLSTPLTLVFRQPLTFHPDPFYKYQRDEK